MRAVLDACVLYPPVMRQILIGAAGRGHFAPLWSARILEEWARASARQGAAAELGVRAEIARLAEGWPGAVVAPADLPREALPDPDDLHVLGACVGGGAGFLVTRNHRDFPTGTLARHGVSRADPDPFLAAFVAEDAELAGLALVVARAAAPDLVPRAVLKRAGLPRLGRLLAGV